MKELFIASEDGTEIPIVDYECANSSHAIIILPAMGVRASYYKDVASALNSRNIHAITFEQRGHGRSKARPSRGDTFGYKDYALNDLVAVIEHIKALYPNQKIHLMGHSLGGHMAITLKALKPNSFDRIILCASGSPYYKAFDTKMSIKARFLCAIAPILIGTLGYFPGNLLGFAGKEYPQLFRDWIALAKDNQFNFKYITVNLEQAVSEIKGKVMCLSFSDDDLAPLSASKVFLNRMNSADITLEEFTSNRLGGPAGHFTWKKSSSVITDLLVSWLE